MFTQSDSSICILWLSAHADQWKKRLIEGRKIISVSVENEEVIPTDPTVQIELTFIHIARRNPINVMLCWKLNSSLESWPTLGKSQNS